MGIDRCHVGGSFSQRSCQPKGQTAAMSRTHPRGRHLEAQRSPPAGRRAERSQVAPERVRRPKA